MTIYSAPFKVPKSLLGELLAPVDVFVDLFKLVGIDIGFTLSDDLKEEYGTGAKAILIDMAVSLFKPATLFFVILVLAVVAWRPLIRPAINNQPNPGIPQIGMIVPKPLSWPATPTPTLTPTPTPTPTATPSPTPTPLPMPIRWGEIQEGDPAWCVATNTISEEEFLEMASSLQLEGEWRYEGSGGLLIREEDSQAGNFQAGTFLEGCFSLYPWPAPQTGDFYLDAISGYRMVRDRIIPVLFSRYWYQLHIDHDVSNKILVQP